MSAATLRLHHPHDRDSASPTIPTPTPAESAPLLVDATEVARLLGIGESTVWRLASSGKLPESVRVGRSRRWRRAELEAWIVAGCPSRSAWERIRAKGGA